MVTRESGLRRVVGWPLLLNIFAWSLLLTLLASPFLLLRLTGDALIYRWYAPLWLLAALVGGQLLAWGGRQALAWLLPEQEEGGARTRIGWGQRLAAARQRYPWLRWVGSLALVVALVIGLLALPFLPGVGRYPIDLATSVLIYVLLGLGLTIVVGWAGLLDLGYVAFYALGAYGYALANQLWGLSFWWGLPVSALIAAVAALLVGLPVLRLRGDYLAIVTLGFAEMVRLVLINWQSVTGGPAGLGGIARPSLFGISFSNSPNAEQIAFHEWLGVEFSTLQRIVFLYIIILLLVSLIYLALRRLRRLPLGLAWEAVREDEVAAVSLGLNVTRLRLAAYMLGASLAGIAGCFFAARQGFISPESFTFNESALVLAVVVWGGLGSQAGVVLAAMLLVLLPELLRDLADYRLLLFGAAIVWVMVKRPGGLIRQPRPDLLAAAQGRAGEAS